MRSPSFFCLLPHLTLPVGLVQCVEVVLESASRGCCDLGCLRIVQGWRKWYTIYALSFLLLSFFRSSKYSTLADASFAPDSFTRFIHLSAESDARTRIVYDFFDLLTAIAAHSKANGFSGRKLSRYAGWWAFEQKDAGQGFDAAYRNWAR